MELPDDQLVRAVEFHGHLGPFLVLGLRAGLLGTHILGKSYFELKATVETAANPPRSCFIDGVQFSSGCTTGKGNLSVKTSSNVAVEFVRGRSRLRITVKDEILKMLDDLSSEKQVEALSKEILRKTDDDIFVVRTD